MASRADVPWDDVRVLLALERHGSAPAAARALGMASSTVYRRLAALDAHLGVPCVERGAVPATLTETGRALVAVAARFQTALREVHAGAQRAHEHVEGRVTTTTVEGFHPFLVRPLTELATRHPELLVDVHLVDDGPSVRRREADIAISLVRNPPEGLVGRRLRPIEYAVFGTPEARDRTPRRWVVLGAQRTAGPEAAWEQENAHPAAVATGSRTLMQDLVSEGVGVALLPRRLAERHAPWVELTEYSASTAALRRDVWLLTHPDVRDRAAVRVVFDALVQALS